MTGTHLGKVSVVDLKFCSLGYDPHFALLPRFYNISGGIMAISQNIVKIDARFILISLRENPSTG